MNWGTSIAFLMAILATASPTQAEPQRLLEAWNLNDVSILYSLPKSNEEFQSYYLHPFDAGDKGELIPKNIFSMVPPLINADKSNETHYETTLTAVSLRFDPCPIDENLNCSPELRIVWQPLEIHESNSSWSARDATLHSFYKLSESDFNSLREQLWQLKLTMINRGVSTFKVPLNIHPAFENPKTRLNFAKALKKIILSHCGAQNLQKVTFMSLLVPTRWWRFGSLLADKNNHWGPELIPRIDMDFEDIFNVGLEPEGSSFQPGLAMDSIFNIIPEEYPENEDLTYIINKGFRKNTDEDLETFKKFIGTIDKFRSPHESNSSTLDCASCHYADATKHYMEKRFPELKLIASQFKYVNPNPIAFDLSNLSVVTKGTRVVRAFGYFDDEKAIITRTINDSAESAHWLNTHK